MKILLCNKFYYHRGGDCIYTMNLERLLKEQGHEVAIYAMKHPNNERSEWDKYWADSMGVADALTRPFGARNVAQGFTRLIEYFCPDVVHLNNIHTQLSPIIAKIAYEHGIRVVWTLHDTKLVCPCYTCMRDGKWCTECFEDKKAVMRHRCMHGSLPQSVIGYLEAKKWNKEKLQRYTDLFIAPSQFMMDTMVKGGFSEDKFSVLCNFINTDKLSLTPHSKGDHYVYLGRVDDYKGVRTLCRAASRLPYKLIVIGDGPLLSELRQEYQAHIEFIGHQPWEKFKSLLQSARFMVLPSECSENNPLTVIEAMCLGTPVLGARIGGIPELIEEDGKPFASSGDNDYEKGRILNGMTFESGNEEDLSEKITRMYSSVFDYDGIANKAHDKYSSPSYLSSLTKIYGGG